MGSAVVGGHEDGGGEGEAEGGEAEEKGEVVEPPEFLQGECGLELRPGAEVGAERASRGGGGRGVAVARGGMRGSHSEVRAEQRIDRGTAKWGQRVMREQGCGEEDEKEGKM